MRSTALVEVAAVADVVEIDASEFHVEFVQHSVVAYAKFEFGAALQTLVGKGIQSCAQLIHLALDGFAEGGGQGVERARESGRPDLKRGGHTLIEAAAWCIGPPQSRGAIDRAWL